MQVWRMQIDESFNSDNDVVVRPCPSCPVRSIRTKSALECYHVTCEECAVPYCGVCGFQNRADTWVTGHFCVDGNNIAANSPLRRKAIYEAYVNALKDY